MASPAACDCALEVNEKGERGTLIVLLGLNLLLLIVEVSIGWKAKSSALLADSIDNLADAMVYAISLYAVGRAASLKARAARLSGGFQIFLVLVVVGDIIRRALADESPESWFIIGVGLGALGVNILCLTLISRYRTGGIHMKASFIFSQNDVIANTATVVTGIIIMFTEQYWLDLVVGGCISLLVLYGAIRIFRNTKDEQVTGTESTENKDESVLTCADSCKHTGMDTPEAHPDATDVIAPCVDLCKQQACSSPLNFELRVFVV